MIDIIIVGPYDQTTKNCIKSVSINSVYEHTVTVVPMDGNGYNAALNKGAKWAKGKSEFTHYYAFCNNDILFNPDWDTRLMDDMKEQLVKSASPCRS